ncbi:MAG: hypothetical protein ACM336_21835 [Acidobacteriota bacterium]
MRVIGLIFAAMPLAAAVTNVRVAGTTNTQAVIAYTAPGAAACTLKVSETNDFSAGYKPVNDVNTALFPGSDRDDRPGNVNSGIARVFVLGKRAAEKAADGFRYSRALAAETRYYFQISCGADTASSQFKTANLAFGGSYIDAIPVDPNAPGETAWPSIDWTPAGDTRLTDQKIVDPQTGVLIRRIGAPGKWWQYETVVAPDSAKDASGAWTNPGSVTASDGASAGYTGSGSGTQPWLWIRSNWTAGANGGNYSDDYNQLDYIVLNLKGGAAGASGDNASVEVCLTVDGVNCATAIKTQDLTACGSSCAIGDKTPILKFWQDPAAPLKSLIPRPSATVASGTATYDQPSRTLTWASGTFFNTNWTHGSHIVYDGTAYVIEKVISGRKAVLVAGPPASTPAKNFTAPNFGALVRKKTANANKISIDYVSFTTGYSHGDFWWYGGGTMCSNDKVVQPGTGRLGYHCVVPVGSGSTYMIWFEPESGDATYLGWIYSIGPGWNGQSCSFGSLVPFKRGDANVFYCGVTMTDGSTAVVEGTYTGNNENVASKANISATWRKVSGDVCQMIQDFSATDPTGPQFDKTLFGCPAALQFTHPTGVYGHVMANRAGQSTFGWAAVLRSNYDGSSQVMGAASMHGRYPLRYCVNHGGNAWIDKNGTGWAAVTVNDFAGNATCGGGPLQTETLASLPASGNDPCPANPFGTTGRGCTVVQVSGEPYDPSPCASENNRRGADGPYGAWQVAQPGDLFRIDTEWMQLLAKNGSNWTFLRAVDGVLAAHNPGVITGVCTVNNNPYRYPSGGQFYWKFLEDPHGKNSIVPVLAAHGMNAQDRFNQAVHITWGPACPNMPTASYVAYNGYETFSQKHLANNPDVCVSSDPKFAGVSPPNGGQPAHLTHGQNTGRQWVIDVRPRTLTSAKPAVTPVGTSGQLYKLAWGAGQFHRKMLPTSAFCGAHPLKDISGPGSAIADSSADSWKYCVAERAGECRAGSAAGDVYANCPGVTQPSCYSSTTDSGGNELVDICVEDSVPYADVVVQVGLDGFRRDLNGSRNRVISRALSQPRRNGAYQNAHVTVDGKWALTQARWLDGVQSQAIAIRLPSYGASDSVNRSTFVPVHVRVAPVSGTDNVLAEFGYDPAFSCTSRREACVSVTGGSTAKQVNEAVPFYWAGDSVAGVPCSSGCTVTIPAVSQRVLYYRIKHRRADGSVVATGSTEVAVVP